MVVLLNLAAAVTALWAAACAAQKPSAMYDGGFGNDTEIQLRIGNGGAGESGLIAALANAFVQEQVAAGSPKFRVAWYTSDTTYSIEYLKLGILDVGITYVPAAEEIAIKQDIALSPSYYLFRDHFLLVGPKSNPANVSKSDDIETIFSTIHQAAENRHTTPAVRFLSRYDKSATHIKESALWAAIGQTPWGNAYSTWYHQYIEFPIQSLTAAILLNEYTLSDWGTMLSLDPKLANQTVVYKHGSDNATDPLLNPAHLLIGKMAPNPTMAKAFAEWAISEKGQDVIRNFKKNGQQMYSPAPPLPSGYEDKYKRGFSQRIRRTPI